MSLGPSSDSDAGAFGIRPFARPALPVPRTSAEYSCFCSAGLEFSPFFRHAGGR